MGLIELKRNSRGFTTGVLEDLVSAGWELKKVPTGAKIPSNVMLIELESNGAAIKLRLLVYKITDSSRGKPEERRVQITKTYGSGLEVCHGYADVVLGYDADTSRYIGLDSRRLRIGGESHNASSFFDQHGLQVGTQELLIIPRQVTAEVFRTGIEYHAFFSKARLAEYLFNHREIHAGTYRFHHVFMKPASSKRALPFKITDDIATANRFVLSLDGIEPALTVSKAEMEAFENRRLIAARGRTITPEQLKAIQLACEEVGALGEQIVIEHERKRLRAKGQHQAAMKVDHVSLRSVADGYDILSFEDDGKTKRYLEVKSTVGNGFIIDISSNEWKTAQKYGPGYYIVRVTNVKDSPKICFFKDPCKIESKKELTKEAAGWRINLRPRK